MISEKPHSVVYSQNLYDYLRLGFLLTLCAEGSRKGEVYFPPIHS